MLYNNCNELLAAIKSAITENDNDIKSVDKKKLFDFIYSIKENKEEFSKASVQTMQQITYELLDNFFYRYIYNKEKATLYDAQLFCNGSIVEDAIINYLAPCLAFGGGGESDHLNAHTGEGIPGADYIVTTPFNLTLDVNDGLTITVETGTSIDAKSYKSIDSLKSALLNNTNGQLGHYGDYLIVYVMQNDAWYLVANNNKLFIYKLLNFTPKFEHPFISLSLDLNNILTVSDLQFR